MPQSSNLSNNGHRPPGQSGAENGVAPIIVVGLGNPILCDDSVGWAVVEQVQARWSALAHASDPAVRFIRAGLGGLALAELLVGATRALLIDAMLTPDSTPGTITHLRLRELPATLHANSPHDASLLTGLTMLRGCEVPLPDPDQIHVIAIEAADVWTFSETCTPPVAAAQPAAVQTALDLLRAWTARPQHMPDTPEQDAG